MDIIEYYNKGNMKKTSHKSRFLKEFGTEDVINTILLNILY